MWCKKKLVVQYSYNKLEESGKYCIVDNIIDNTVDNTDPELWKDISVNK
ncbi:MAG: hypothetical protein AB1567_00465 [bacterium]